ncbi:MAG TPA: hypothetical protein P5267_00175 [Patescibacteria group bacterium]|nr:hypothetical protein [Patescibacteria group bacterium]
MKRYLATLSILVTDRQANVAKVNALLTTNGHLIISRLGVNPSTACLAHCLGIIMLVLSGEKTRIHKLATDLNKLRGIQAKLSFMFSA